MENERHRFPESDSPDNLTTASIAGRAERAEDANAESRERDRRSPANEPAGVTRSGAIITPPTAGTGSAAITGGAAAATATVRAREREEEAAGPLFAHDETENLRHRWDAIQVAFVDEPRSAVEQADHLVAETMKRLAEMFADERTKLEQQWSRGDNVSTEDLRVALRRYRSFFGRLLSI